jgi:hypothetical protein
VDGEPVKEPLINSIANRRTIIKKVRKPLSLPSTELPEANLPKLGLFGGAKVGTPCPKP